MPGAPSKKCRICGRPVLAKGLCAAHYHRDRRGVDAAKPVRGRRQVSTEQVTTKIPAATKDALLSAARSRGVSLYELIGQVLEEWLSAQKR